MIILARQSDIERSKDYNTRDEISDLLNHAQEKRSYLYFEG